MHYQEHGLMIITNSTNHSNFHSTRQRTDTYTSTNTHRCTHAHMDATMSPLQTATTNDRHHSAPSPRIDVLFFLTLNAAILIAFPEALSIQQVGTFSIEHVCDSQSICGLSVPQFSAQSCLGSPELSWPRCVEHRSGGHMCTWSLAWVPSRFGGSFSGRGHLLEIGDLQKSGGTSKKVEIVRAVGCEILAETLMSPLR